MDWKYFVKRAMPGGVDKTGGGVSLSASPAHMRRLLVAKSLLKEGGAAIDVGAHLGNFTRQLSEIIGDRGRVWCFEPNPYLFKFIEKFSKKMPNVVASQQAVSDHVSTKRFFLIPYSLDDTSTLEEQHRQATQKEILVETIPLDDLRLKGIGAVKFVRVDVKGHEKAVFEGAVQLIARSRPYWLFENVNHLGELHDALVKEEYLLVDFHTLEVPPPGAEPTDVLAFPSEKISEMTHLIETLRCF